MQYEVDVNGRIRQANVHRVDGRFVVSLDSQVWHVDASRIGSHTWSLLIGDASREVTVASEPVSGRLVVGVGPVPLSVGLNGRRRVGRKDDGGKGANGPQRLVAPMPGKIVRILAAKGDTVKRRQPLVVIEAMKMENELRALHDGVIVELVVREGQSVDPGALLLVVVPA